MQTYVFTFNNQCEGQPSAFSLQANTFDEAIKRLATLHDHTGGSSDPAGYQDDITNGNITVLIPRDLTNAQPLAHSKMSNPPQIVFRVVTGEPDGICVGFDPREYCADIEVDEYELLADYGGEYVFITGDTPQKIIIHGQKGDPTYKLEHYLRLPDGVMKFFSLYPELDLFIWRTPAEFEQWRAEIFGE